MARFAFPSLAAFAASSVITFGLCAVAFFSLGTGHKLRGVDLVQDYCSAWALVRGEDPYASLSNLRTRAGVPPELQLPIEANPHTPGAFLLVAPTLLAPNYWRALVGLQWVELGLLAVACNWCRVLFCPVANRWAWAVGGGLLSVWAPNWEGLQMGHPVGSLTLFAAGLWWAARAERPIMFGILLGAACQVRVFFAILAVLAVGWPPRRTGAAAVAALGAVVTLFAAAGVTPGHWMSAARGAGEDIGMVGSVPGLLGLGPAASLALYGTVAGVVLLCRWRGLSVDAAAAVALVSAMLFYPMAWYFYDCVLIPVAAWVSGRAAGESRGDRTVRYLLFAYVLMRAVPTTKIDPTGQAGGLVGWADDAMLWRQLVARLLLLAAVLVVARGGVIANGRGPS